MYFNNVHPPEQESELMVLVLQVHFFFSNILLSCIYSKFIKFVSLAESLRLVTNNMQF